MKYFYINFFIIITILPLFSCQKSNKSNIQKDNKSYINDFELLQENPYNQTSVKITSPKAIIDPTNNDIEILESSIEIINKHGQDFQVKSGNSTINNGSNLIKVFNNVILKFINNDDLYISTNSFDLDLNTSVININNPLIINFTNSKIIAMSGFYNINSGLFNINNTEFKRNIYNSEGNEEYQVKIKSDFAKWFKKDNTILFISNEKQVETTINFLLTE